MIFLFFIFFFVFSSLLLSFLRFSFLLSSFSPLVSFLSSPLSLSLLSVSVSVCWWCVCVCVSSCVFVWCCVVWCGACRVVWHAENPVCRLKTLSVCRFKNVLVYAGNTRTCFSACGRGAGTHGDVLNLHTDSVLSLHTAVIASSAYQEQPT